MRLYSLSLAGYRRFADTWVNLEDNVIALIGPNEAGKSSVLTALMALNNDEPIPIPSRTRGRPVTNTSEVIVGRFRLAEDDLLDPPYPLRPEPPRWLIVAKTAGGPRHFRFDPSPQRPLEIRRGALAAIEAAMSDAPLWGALTRDLRRQIAEAKAYLDTDAQALSGEEKQGLLTFTAALKNVVRAPETAEAVRTRAQPFYTAIAAAAAHEQLPSPDEWAASIGERMPRFLEFDEPNRTLNSEYDIGGASNPAFDNLCLLGDINRKTLLAAMRNEDSAGVLEIVRNAETRLARILRDEWTQVENLEIGFQTDGTSLKINVKSARSAYQALQDRSEGMRTFISLRSFLKRRSPDGPAVLIIDEAESHLHYDAQADLVRALEAQRDAQQVIYTTHSLACLPQDLGRGVRAVVPDADSAHSTLDNAWTNQPGIGPLMRAIGAATIPLTPSRHIVIGEGPSDALLLPSLLREAGGGLHALPFQVVSGLASASSDELKRLATETQFVAFLGDGDESGTSRASQLPDYGIKKKRIVQLRRRLCLEDLVDPALYLQAVNGCLKDWNNDAPQMKRADLPATQRPTAVRQWCQANKVKPPGKVHVARRVIQLFQRNDRASRRLIDSARRTAIMRLHGRILRALEISDPAAAAFSRPS